MTACLSPFCEDEPQCKLVCPSNCILEHSDFRESRDELLAKYHSLDG